MEQSGRKLSLKVRKTCKPLAGTLDGLFSVLFSHCVFVGVALATYDTRNDLNAL